MIFSTAVIIKITSVNIVVTAVTLLAAESGSEEELVIDGHYQDRDSVREAWQ